jgi:low temperature requirement protein LtrA
VLLFGIWWIYYLEPAERGLTDRPQFSYFWGYGHWFLFAAIAAAGSGLEVAVDAAAHAPEIGTVAVGYALAVPVAVFFVLLYVLHRPLVERAEVPPGVLLPAAALELLAPLAAPALGVPATVVVIALIAAAVVAVTIASGQGRRSAESS